MFRDPNYLLVPGCYEFMQYRSHQDHQYLNPDTEHCHGINSVRAHVPVLRRQCEASHIHVQLHLCYLCHEEAGHRYCHSKSEVILLNILKVKNSLLFQLPLSKTSRHIVHWSLPR